MRKNHPEKTVYYKDPLNDDFAGTRISHDVIDEKYNYVPKNFFYKIGTYILRGIAMPIIFLLEHLVYGVTIKNRKALKGLKGAYLYGNHTAVFDAFTPMLLSFPRRNKIIANPDAVSIKGIKTIVKMLGVIPLPSENKGMVKFMKDLDYCHKRGENITIYPEAHIWPYYNGVRPFKSTSFHYPVKDGSPTVAFFTAYQKPSFPECLIRKVKVTVYVSDPFYPDKTLKPKEAQAKLRNQVYDFMCDCSKKYSNYEIIRYVEAPDLAAEELAGECVA